MKVSGGKGASVGDPKSSEGHKKKVRLVVSNSG